MEAAEIKRWVHARFAVTTSRFGLPQSAAAAEALRWYQASNLAQTQAPCSRQSLLAMLQRCKDTGVMTELIRFVGWRFSDPDALARCFPLSFEQALTASVGDDADLQLFDWAGMEEAVDLLAEEAPVANALGHAARGLVGTLALQSQVKSVGAMRPLLVALKLAQPDERLQMQVLATICSLLPIGWWVGAGQAARADPGGCVWWCVRVPGPSCGCFSARWGLASGSAD
jgi:hypothetical protein